MPAGRSTVIATASAFAALYLVYGALSGVLVGVVLRGFDIHIVRALIFALVAARVQRFGGTTLTGLVAGLLLSAARFSSPDKPFLAVGTFAAGIVYDGFLRGGSYPVNARAPRRILVATLLSGLAESAIVTGGLIGLGYGFPEATALLRSVLGQASLAAIVSFSLAKNAVGSLVGVVAVTRLVRRPKGSMISSLVPETVAHSRPS